LHEKFLAVSEERRRVCEQLAEARAESERLRTEVDRAHESGVRLGAQNERLGSR
jgi:uncharacterized coiled-coil DUF342 family protein